MNLLWWCRTGTPERSLAPPLPSLPSRGRARHGEREHERELISATWPDPDPVPQSQPHCHLADSAAPSLPLSPQAQAKQTAKEATGGWRSGCGVRVRVACGTLGVCLPPRRCNIPKLPSTECERASERGRVPGGQPQLIGVWQSGDASPSPASLCPFATPIAQYLGGLCKWLCRIQRRNREGKYTQGRAEMVT